MPGCRECGAQHNQLYGKRLGGGNQDESSAEAWRAAARDLSKRSRPEPQLGKSIRC